MAALYVETNLLIAVATGRAPLAHILLDMDARPVRIAIPGICFFEALQWMEGETKRRAELKRKFKEQIQEVKRDVSGTPELDSKLAEQIRVVERDALGVADELIFHLKKAAIHNDSFLQLINDRLFWAIEKLSARAEILAVTPADLEASRNENLIPDLTDNLILHSVLAHARSSPEVDKAIFTENKSDFRRPEARKAMDAANLTYIATPKDMMRWVDSRPGAAPGWRTFSSDDDASGTLS